MLLSAILNTFKPNAVDTVNVIYNNIWREIMKKLSITKMANTIIDKRKAQKLTQAQLAEMTHINRGMISRLESLDYTPSIDQLQAIAEVLDFEVVDLFEDDKPVANKPVLDRKYNIAVAGTGYVGLSIATLLAQHNHVTAVDIIPEKVDLINNRKSPIQDDYIEMYLAEKDLDLTATLDGEEAYRNADFVVIAAPTNYDSKKNFFDCSAVEAVIELVLKVNPAATMIIKSTIPVGYTASVAFSCSNCTASSRRLLSISYKMSDFFVVTSPLQSKCFSDFSKITNR